MIKLKSSDYKKYSKFLNNLANKLTRYYYLKLNKPFKVLNKLKGKGYDPVTNADKAFELFISKEIKKNFRIIKLLERSLVIRKQKAIFLGLLILLMELDHLLLVIQHGVILFL